jgi:hypothetical protein
MRHLLLPPNSFLIRVFDRLQSSRTGVCVLIGGETFGGNHIEWRSREPVWELAAFQSAEVGYRMLQIQHIFSRQNRHREPFARGWWRRECPLIKRNYVMISNRYQSGSAYTPKFTRDWFRDFSDQERTPAMLSRHSSCVCHR